MKKRRTFDKTINANRKEKEEKRVDKREPCKGSDNGGLLIRLERNHDVTVRSPLPEQGKQKTELLAPSHHGSSAHFARRIVASPSCYCIHAHF